MTISRERFLGAGRYLAVTSSHKLTYGLARAWNVSAATSGKSVKLDDARRIGLGFGQYVLHNSGPNAIAVKDAADTTLFSLAGGSVATLGLVRNSTAAGKWIHHTGAAGSGRTYSRGTRDAIAAVGSSATTEPICTSDEIPPTGCDSAIPCLDLEIEAFATCIEGYNTAKQNFLVSLYVGDSVQASCEWFRSVFGVDLCGCATGGTFTDGAGHTFSWSYTGGSDASCGDDYDSTARCDEITIVWSNRPT